MSDTENKVVTLTTARETERVSGISQDLITQIISETTRQVEARANRPSPMRLETWEEIESFAERAARSQMTPERYQGYPDDIIMAVMKGKEVGLPPITALESIAVIDKKACIYGQAVPALCWASGKCENIEERFEGEEGTDAYTAVCIVKRRGVPSPFIGRFSVKDSKVAGLYGKRVHGSYPKRMLQWRARYALDDAFPDVLMGLATREIVEEDASKPQWAMPKPTKGWLDRKAGKAADGWDDTWFSGFVAKLGQEMNAWKWMELLLEGLKQAPTKRDVDEIDDMPMVQNTVAAAPPETQPVILEAFAEARKRFASAESKPAVAKAATEAPQGSQEASAKPPMQTAPDQQAATTAVTEFEYPLLDEWGEPVEGEIFTDAKAFIRAFSLMAAKSNNREALLEQNADALTDARALGAIPDMTDLSDDKGAPQVIEAPANGTRDTWRDWLTRFRGAVATLTTAGYPLFVAANTDVVRSSPATVRPLAFKALDARADELGIPRPNTDSLKPAKPAETVVETKPAENAEPVTTDTEAPTDPDSVDPLAQGLATFREALAKCQVPVQCDNLVMSPASSALGTELRAAGRQDDIDQLKKDVENRKAELRAGA